ncbi:MAG: toxic anion resistance protein [Actinomycetes bacterium]
MTDTTSGTLNLTPPAAVTAVEPAEAEKEVAIPPEAAERIDAVVGDFVATITGLDVHGDDYRRRVDDINGMADREIRATSDVSNRLLDRPVRAVDGLGDGRGSVAHSLLDLRRTVEDLNPARYDLSRGGRRKVLGLIPFGSKIRAYFQRYQKAQSHIQGVVGALRDGAAELDKDNAAIAQEQKALWTQMETLRQYAYMAERLDTALEARIVAIEADDPDRGRVLREDVLFPVRHRRQEILTQLAVSVQGYAALRVVEMNNRELIRAVRTATTTTVAALRTAVMVAQALTNQKLVSEQVRAVHEVTSTMIEGTSGLLRDQAATVEEQATSPGVDLPALQRAWDNVFAALDQIDTYKLRALEAMKVTVNQLSDQVERSHAQVERLHAAETKQSPLAAAGSGLQLP